MSRRGGVALPPGSLARLEARSEASTPQAAGAAPALPLLAAAATLGLLGLHIAARSRLAAQVSPGESAAFAWVRVHVDPALGFALAALGALAAWQWWTTRRAAGWSRSAIRGLVLAQLAALGLLLGALWSGALPLAVVAHAALQAALVGQALTPVLTRSLRADAAPLPLLTEARPFTYLGLVFVLAALPAVLDPSFGRIRRHVTFDSALEWGLVHTFPPLLSGAAGLWLGAIALGALALGRALAARAGLWPGLRPGAAVLPFLIVPAASLGLFAWALGSAIGWELGALGLEGVLPGAWLLLTGAAATASLAAFPRLLARAPRGPATSAVGLGTLAATLGWFGPLLPAWLDRWAGRPAWRALLAAALLVHGGLLGLALWGGLFDPWFTVYSHLKSLLLKLAAAGGAGIGLLLLDEPRGARPPAAVPATRRAALAAALAAVLAFVPFAALERWPETKAAVLEFHELAMVDATVARTAATLLALDGWVRLGQAPPREPGPGPWPLPWTLARRAPSRLPADFDLVVIVVDALRGDALGLSGYRRDLTPFLDRWAREDAVAFRRAYSQGGGTFAAMPLLLAGRSRLDLYGPGIDRTNLVWKLAETEGIRHVVMTGRSGPRAAFPPDAVVLEIDPAGSRPDGRSWSADQVFGQARAAIGALAPGARYLAFLQLMDVHNDLWKKPGAPDFGDAPRDLYDSNVAYVDGALARFVAWLRATDRYDRTVLVVTSDHGEQFWEHGASLHGHTLFEEELRVPVILRLPGLAGRILDVPVVAADIAPTLVDLAGYAVTPPYDDPHMGISLVPLLVRDERARYLRRDVVGRASFKRRYFLYRDWRWKLVYSADFDVLQLFDVLADPAERANRVQEHPALARELERTLFGYLARVEGRRYRPLLGAPLTGPRAPAWAGGGS